MNSSQIKTLYQRFIRGDNTVAKQIITGYADLPVKTSADTTKYLLFKKVHLHKDFMARFTLNQFTKKRQ